MTLTLLIGGARAGKSALAQDMATRSALPVTVVATATAGDEEMAARIARHRSERPAGWHTREEPRDLAGAIGATPTGHCLLVDCLTLWTTNLLLAGLDQEAMDDACRRAVDAVGRREGPTLVVTNETGLGVVPATALGRAFVDAHGRVNAQWAAAAQRALLVVGGLVLPLHAAGDLRA